MKGSAVWYTQDLTHCLSSLVPPEKVTARAKAISKTMKKPVMPQKAFAIAAGSVTALVCLPSLGS